MFARLGLIINQFGSEPQPGIHERVFCIWSLILCLTVEISFLTLTYLFFKLILSTISGSVNFYLVCAFLFSAELRVLENYPIFLLTLVDYIVTVFGYLMEYIANQFVLRSYSVDEDKSTSHGIEAYIYVRTQIQNLIQEPILGLFHTFWFGCLPKLMISRLNEYGNGFCSLLIAYERFILICRPLQKNNLLTSNRRKLNYVVVTLLIFLPIVGESVYHYSGNHVNCMFIYYSFKKPMIGQTVSLISAIFISLLPGICSVICYYKSAIVLLSRKKKIGRNLNLVFCFGAICVVWLCCVTLKISCHVYYIAVLSMVPGMFQTFYYPLFKNGHHIVMVFLVCGATSMSNPFLFLISKKDYRKPFLKAREKLTQCKGKVIPSESEADIKLKVLTHVPELCQLQI